MELNKYYTYAHIRLDTNKIFYIGKGKDYRFNAKNRNKYWKNIAEKYGYRAEILAYWDTDKEAINHEILLISCFKDMVYKLANLTNGGEGMAGMKFTEEHRQKMSKAHTGKVLSDAHKEATAKGQTGLKRTEAHKKAMSDCRIGKKRGFYKRKAWD